MGDLLEVLTQHEVLRSRRQGRQIHDHAEHHCQNGLFASHSPMPVATATATAKLNHIQVIQVGRNGGGRGMIGSG
jgi:hypothetical protein